MKKGFFGSLLALLAGTGLSFSQDVQPIGYVESGPAQTATHSGDGSGNKPAFWFNANYLRWWSKDGPVTAALATSYPAGAARPGTIGGPATTILFNAGQELDFGGTSGFRVNGGAWIDGDATFGVEFSYFQLERTQADYLFASDGSANMPGLARPFFDIASNGNTAIPIAIPGGFSGSIGISADSRLYGLDANALINLVCDEELRIDALVGFLNLGLFEGLSVESQSIRLPGPGLVASSFILGDTFRANNFFYGAQLGTKAEYRMSNLFISGHAKLGLGANVEFLSTAGSTRSSTPFGTFTRVRQGLLSGAPPARVRDSEFSVIPQVGFKVGFLLFDCLRAYAGYDFLYWTNVARPGNQINDTVDARAVPRSPFFNGSNTMAPPVLIRQADYWAQGITFGLELTF